jgi:hypothetical protein
LPGQWNSVLGDAQAIAELELGIAQGAAGENCGLAALVGSASQLDHHLLALGGAGHLARNRPQGDYLR